MEKENRTRQVSPNRVIPLVRLREERESSPVKGLMKNCENGRIGEVFQLE